MKSNLRVRIDHYLRKRRKGLLNLDGNLKNYPRIIHLATQRPVNLPKISHELIYLKKNLGAVWVNEVETLIIELLDKKCTDEAANIHASLVRAVATIDVEMAIELGLKYIPQTHDTCAVAARDAHDHGRYPNGYCDWNWGRNARRLHRCRRTRRSDLGWHLADGYQPDSVGRDSCRGVGGSDGLAARSA